MVNEIIHGMRTDIERSKWLDSISKQGALRKLSAMEEFVGFPDWYEDNVAVEKYYKDVRFII